MRRGRAPLRVLRALAGLPFGATRHKLAEDLELNYRVVWMAMEALEAEGLVDRATLMRGRGSAVVYRVHPSLRGAALP